MMLSAETEAVLDILDILYIPEGIFLNSILEYCLDKRTLKASFSVPESESYVVSGVDIDYVTTEQFIRCISQLSCSLIFLLSMEGDDVFGFIRREHFERIWYRKTDLRYKRHIAKGKDFEISAVIIDVYTLHEFWISRIRIRGAVQGEIELVLRRR